jgi:hypothetical protein
MPGEPLLPLRDVTSHLRVLGESFVGVQAIPIDLIVGSVDRSVDFDQLFRPRRKDLRRRIDAVRSYLANRPMPPISVIEAGGLYFIIDGHHRVAVARQDKAEFIDAEVTRVRTSHRLHPGVDLLELVHTDQHRRFKERTDLKHVAPEAKIVFSRPTGYAELLQVIQVHAYELSERLGQFVSLPDATRDWYAASWLPALAAIDATGLRAAYEFKTDGDRYLWTYRTLQELRSSNREASWTDAAASLAQTPVQRRHRNETLAARRTPLPPN